MKLSTAFTLLMGTLAPFAVTAEDPELCAIFPVVMDLSGSIGEAEFSFLRDSAIPRLLTQIDTNTIVRSFVCSVEYGKGSSAGLQEFPINNGCAASGDAVGMGNVLDFEKGQGSFEDGYDAMQFAAEKVQEQIQLAANNTNNALLEGCDEVACFMILVTDEDRDVNDGTPNTDASDFPAGPAGRMKMTNFLKDNNFVLNAIINAQVDGDKVPGGQSTDRLNIGVVYDKTVIQADPGDEYNVVGPLAVAAPQDLLTAGFGTSIEDYARVAFDTKGAVWNLNKLRQDSTDGIPDVFPEAFADSLADIKLAEVEDKVNKNVTGGGDPHFSTWSGEKFSYHGECDLVLVQDPAFDQDLGLYIHGRTKIHKSWSAFESAAVKIGEDVFEVHGKNEYWLNGERMAHLPAKVGGKQVVLKVSGEHISRYDITIAPGTKIILKAYDDFVWVSVEGSTHYFAGSHGLMGSYNGHLLARDGETVMTDPNEFGQEWQVRDTDLQLFHNAEGPQYPQKCLLPVHPKFNLEETIRLGGSAHVEAAKKACDHAGVHLKDDCIADVLATNDLAMAAAY